MLAVQAPNQQVAQLTARAMENSDGGKLKRILVKLLRDTPAIQRNTDFLRLQELTSRSMQQCKFVLQAVDQMNSVIQILSVKARTASLLVQMEMDHIVIN